MAALAESVRRDRWLANAYNHSAARVAQIADTWVSSGNSKLQHGDFLPFDLEERAGAKRISAEAARTIQGLIRARELPLAIAAALMEDVEPHRS